MLPGRRKLSTLDGSWLTTIHSTAKNPDDIVITLAIRTPLTKARKGGFRDTTLEYLIYAILKEVRERSNIDPGLVEDICVGNVRSHSLVTTPQQFPSQSQSPDAAMPWSPC